MAKKRNTYLHVEDMPEWGTQRVQLMIPFNDLPTKLPGESQDNTWGRLELTQVIYDALVDSYTIEEGEPWPAAEAVVTALVRPE